MTTTMTTPHDDVRQRVDTAALSPHGYAAVLALERHLRANVDRGLLEIVKLRASILNGCAFCVDMHSTDAVGHGEDPRRLFAVAAWHESPFFTPAERTALSLTDAVTRLGDGGVPDDVWRAAVDEFGERQVVELLLAIATINVWNRLAVATHLPPPPLELGGIEEAAE